MTMRAANFLFPPDLRVTGSGIKNVLVVGSCAAAQWAHLVKPFARDVRIDVINAYSLPETPPLPIEEYDFQFVQLALRNSVSDRVISFKDYMGDELRLKNLNHLLDI